MSAQMKEHRTNGHERELPGAGIFLLGSIVGGLAGVAAALLWAPQSGKRTQRQIQSRALELRGKMMDAVDDRKKGLEHNVLDVRKSIADWLDEGADLLESRAQDIRTPSPES